MKFRRYNFRRNHKIILFFGLIFSLAFITLVVLAIIYLFSTEREVSSDAVLRIRTEWRLLEFLGDVPFVNEEQI